MPDLLLNFQALGYASLSRAMFADMQRDYHRTKDEYEAVARYWEELHHSKEELQGAIEVVTSYRRSILALEKEKEYADLERDRAKADLEKAKIALQDKDRALQVAAREYDALKAKVAVKVAKARERPFKNIKTISRTRWTTST